MYRIGRSLCTRTDEIYTTGDHNPSGLRAVRLDAMTHGCRWITRGGHGLADGRDMWGAREGRCATRGVRVWVWTSRGRMGEMRPRPSGMGEASGVDRRGGRRDRTPAGEEAKN